MGVNCIQQLILSVLCLNLSILLSRVDCAPATDSNAIFLTPLIKAGDLEGAKAAALNSAELANVKSERVVTSYSGYLTIDEAKGSNLFFWFFPAEENPGKAPLILSVSDIPGVTCFKSVFLETGPFTVDDNNGLVHRNHSFTRTNSFLYIDSPVGTGFSFSKESAYVSSSDEEVVGILEALKQFFALFNEFKERDFYMAGDGFATMTIPKVGLALDKAGGTNFKGMIIGSPYLEENQLKRTQSWYNLGLMDERERDDFEAETVQHYDLARAGKGEEAMKKSLWIWGPTNSLWSNYTGFKDIRSALSTKPPPGMAQFIKFLNSKESQQYLHVGPRPLSWISLPVFERLFKDFVSSQSAPVEELLEKGYRVLFYAPQFGLILPVGGVTDAVGHLKWKGADKLAAAPRKIWRVKNDVAGYVKSADNLTFAILRNAGNYGIVDQPEWVADLVETFLNKAEV